MLFLHETKVNGETCTEKNGILDIADTLLSMTDFSYKNIQTT